MRPIPNKIAATLISEKLPWGIYRAYKNEYAAGFFLHFLSLFIYLAFDLRDLAKKKNIIAS